METIKVNADIAPDIFEAIFDYRKPVIVAGAFFKVNGDKREFKGILNYKDENVKGTGKSNRDTFKDSDTVSYFDTDKNGWRRFKLDRLDTITLNAKED